MMVMYDADDAANHGVLQRDYRGGGKLSLPISQNRVLIEKCNGTSRRKRVVKHIASVSTSIAQWSNIVV